MNSHNQTRFEDLPGAGHIQQGLRDYRENRHTISSCLVRIARPRLAKAGLIESTLPHDTKAELDLYQLLSGEGNRAHSRYNALIRELVSFERALDHRLRLVSSTTPNHNLNHAPR